MAPSQLGVFAHSSPSYSRPNVEFHVQPLSLERFGQPLHTYDAITASVCNLRPTSRGSVHISSADFDEAPKIQPRYLSTDEDLVVAADSLRLARRIVLQSLAFAPYRPEEVKPGSQYQTEDELRKAAGDVGTTIFHPVGTCKMGPATSPDSVVSSKLSVHGVRGLRVADASVMPTITSGNTAAPTMVIAERAADIILINNN
jgi:choline dehydrogenase